MEPTRVRGLRGYVNETSIGSDWSVLEETNSSYFGEGDASVGGIEFSTAEMRNSAMAAGKPFTLIDSERGPSRATSSDVSISSGTVSVSGDGPLSRLNVDRSTLGAGGEFRVHDGGNDINRQNWQLTAATHWDPAELGLPSDLDWSSAVVSQLNIEYSNIAVLAPREGGSLHLAILSDGGALLWQQDLGTRFGNEVAAVGFFEGSGVIGVTRTSIFRVLLAWPPVGAEVGQYDGSYRMLLRGRYSRPGLILDLSDNPVVRSPAGYPAAAIAGGEVYFKGATTGEALRTTNLEQVWSSSDFYPNAPNTDLSGVTTSSWLSSAGAGGVGVPMSFFSDGFSPGSSWAGRGFSTTFTSTREGDFSIQGWELFDKIPTVGTNTLSTTTADLYLDGPLEAALSDGFNIRAVSGSSSRLSGLNQNNTFVEVTTLISPVTTSPALGYTGAAIFTEDGIAIALYNAAFGGTSHFEKSLLSHAVGLVRPFRGIVFDAPLPGATNPPVIGWSGSVWSYVNEWAQVYDKSILALGEIMVVTSGNGESSVYNADPPRVRDPDGVSISGQLDSPTRFVAVECLNARTANSLFVFYNAFDAGDEGGTSFSIGVGERATHVLETVGYPAWIQQLTRFTWPPTNYQGTTSFRYGSSGYYLIASDDLPVAAGQFEAYGGSVSVEINPDEPGTILLNIVGPTQEIPGVGAPFVIGISDGDTTRGALTICGTGTIVSPTIERYSTGADWSLVPEDAEETPLSSPLIATRQQSAAVGRRLAQVAGLPRLSVSLDIASHNSASFGLVVGTVHRVRDKLWRVIAAEHATGRVSLTMEPYSNSEEFAQVWSGRTHDEFLQVWDGLTGGDMNVEPLRVE